MRNRLSRHDFLKSHSWTARLNFGGDACWKCDRYKFSEIKGAEQGVRTSYKITPAYPPEIASKWSRYYPLTDKPDLFLSFARLYEQDRSVETVSAWVHEYGLLGIGTGEDDQEGNGAAMEETTDVFFREVHRAAAVLAAYEAVLNGDHAAAKHTTRVQFKEFTDEYWDYYLENGYMEKPYGAHLGFAHTFAALESEWVVKQLAGPYTVMDFGTPPRSKAETRWFFTGPLGAMYLQMNWLIRAGEEITRCLYCGKSVSLSHPQVGFDNCQGRSVPRKPRKDKKFCSGSCRRMYHYYKRES